MARGQQKIQSQQKAAKKAQELKRQQGHDQKTAAQKALVFTCAVCKVSSDAVLIFTCRILTAIYFNLFYLTVSDARSQDLQATF